MNEEKKILMPLYYLIDRLKERSTWIGISITLTSLGYYFTNVTIDEIISLMLALGGLVFALFPDEYGMEGKELVEAIGFDLRIIQDEDEEG